MGSPGKPAPGGGLYGESIPGFGNALNQHGDAVFEYLVDATAADSVPVRRRQGVFRVDSADTPVPLVRPGVTLAPRSKPFLGSFINDQGDVAFGAHVAGETCNTFGQKQADPIFCAESVYLYRKRTGRIVSIARHGEAAPGGGKYNLAFGGALNSHGDVAFIGDRTLPPASLEKTGSFLWSRGSTVAVARPGDTMPGGGRMVTAAIYVQTYSLNDRGEVFFLMERTTTVCSCRRTARSA